MHFGLTGQNSALGLASRLGIAALGIVMAISLAACTTVEGTNAMTDVGTFEREVMSSTARGVGLIPGEAPKEELTTARAPLVLPTSGQSLPAPQAQTASASLPANSDTVRVDTASLSAADLQSLRNARVVDANSVNGRPLTEEEARTMSARMLANGTVSANRPLYLPPEQYFTRVGNSDLICSTPSGELVGINDARCPAQVRDALARAQRAQNVTSSGPIGSRDARLTDSDIGQ